jgi:hypothetical protein
LVSASQERWGFRLRIRKHQASFSQKEAAWWRLLRILRVFDHAAMAAIQAEA